MESDEDGSRKLDESKCTAEDEEATMKSPRSGRNVKRQKIRDEPQLDMPPSPPSFVSMRQLTEAANAFYNMSLAHEITVDSDFRIDKYEPSQQNSIVTTVKETMHRAFWDLLRSSLESDPPDYGPALKLLGDIKVSLNGLVLPNQKSLQRLIDRNLDLTEAENQIQQTGHLNLEAYAIQVINMMRQFCAPVRDQEVENLRKIDDPVEAFRNAFVLLEKMHMDLANFTIIQMRPYIRQQAVNYERTKFDEFLKTQRALGIDGLQVTREWINAAYKRITPNADPTNSVSTAFSMGSLNQPRPEPSDNEESGDDIMPTPNNILREAYLSLLNWPEGKDWPETMIMDRQRIIDLGKQLDNIVLLTSLVLVVCNFVSSNSAQLLSQQQRLAVNPEIMRNLRKQVCYAGLFALHNRALSSEDRSKVLADELICAVERWFLTIPTKDTDQNLAIEMDLYIKLTEELAGTLKNQINQVVSGQHAVYILMHKRALGFLRLALSSRPPETLPLPPGFSILLTAKDAPSGPTESAQPGTSATPILPPMATGFKPKERPRPSVVPISPKRTSNQDPLNLSSLASRMLPLLAHNRHVFGPKYAEIIQSILVPNASGSGSPQPGPSNPSENATL